MSERRAHQGIQHPRRDPVQDLAGEQTQSGRRDICGVDDAAVIGNDCPGALTAVPMSISQASSRSGAGHGQRRYGGGRPLILRNARSPAEVLRTAPAKTSRVPVPTLPTVARD